MTKLQVFQDSTSIHTNRFQIPINPQVLPKTNHTRSKSVIYKGFKLLCHLSAVLGAEDNRC